MTLIKKLTFFSLILTILSCSKSDDIIEDNLDFIVLSNNGDYSSLFQLSVFESGEVLETDLVAEFGGLDRITRIPRPYQIGGELFLYDYYGATHIKNLRTNQSKSIKTLCGITLENNGYHITTTENKIIAIMHSKEENREYLLTIDNNLEQSDCIELPDENQSDNYSFINSSSFQYSNSKYILFDKLYLADDNYNTPRLIYSYNTESNEINSINIEEITDNFTPSIILDEEKFYSFHNGTYKTYDFEFNLLEEEGTITDEEVYPISGSHIINNKIEVEIFKSFGTGFYSTRNVYDIEQKKLLIDQTQNTEEPNITITWRILTYEFDIKKERIIYGTSNSESDFKILITDFNDNILNEIPINLPPISINIL